MKTLRINKNRLMSDLEELSQIGGTGDGGVNRPALTKANLDARAWLKKKIAEAGLEFSQDPAGNHSGILRSQNQKAKTLLIGSHLDSVPYGGRFDGALGVLTGLEVLRTIKEAGLQLDVNLEVIDFTDEEGTLVGLLGSKAVAGSLSKSELENPRGGFEVLEERFIQAGITDPLSAIRDPGSLAGYLEVHIEQGSRLIEGGFDIGIVSALVGIVSFEIVVEGRADHAGTTKMDERKDAGFGAAAYMVEARSMVMKDFPDSVINFGACSFSPGAYNIVPDRAVLALEFRSPAQSELDDLESRLMTLLKSVCASNELGVSYVRQGCHSPAPCSPIVKQAFLDAAIQLGLRTTSLFSGAGHDTQAMAAICPSGMIFIPSTGGSHNPAEFATAEACENGANVILQTVLQGWGTQG